MKMRMKSLCMALLMMLCVISMTACGSKEVVEEAVDVQMTMDLEQNEMMYLQALGAIPDEQIEELATSEDAFTVSAVTAWADNREELGGFVEILSSEVEKNEEGLMVITSDVKFENREATVTMNFKNDQASGYMVPTYMTIEAQYSLKELVGQAGLNTLMGVGVVFGVLLFLTILISCFKFIGSAVDGSNKKAAKATAAPKTPVAAAAPVVEENLVDDGELVAVIAAAIAASENTSTDSFVVRSIRRKNSNKWSRA